MKIKAHIIIALAAIVSLLFLVPIAAVEDENQEWKIVDRWTAMDVSAKIRMDISTTGLFGLAFGSPQVLMEFRLIPEKVKPVGKWIEIEYKGPSGITKKGLPYDEVNGTFWFTLTQVKLDDSRLIYPFNTYSTKFVILENVSLKRSEENIDAPGQKFLKTKISWEGDTISLKIERDLKDAALLLVGILAIFVTIFGFSKAFFRKSVGSKSRTPLIERIGGLFISFVTAMGAVYMVLAGFGFELMPIFSVIFWALAPLAHIILLMFGKIWNKFLKYPFKGLRSAWTLFSGEIFGVENGRLVGGKTNLRGKGSLLVLSFLFYFTLFQNSQSFVYLFQFSISNFV